MKGCSLYLRQIQVRPIFTLARAPGLIPVLDDLNPLYVYESKMSLFVRMSQTRLGCERLLEAQLIPILAQCDYLDARPEADLTFMGVFYFSHSGEF